MPQECLPKETKLVSHMDSVCSASVEPFGCSLGDQVCQFSVFCLVGYSQYTKPKRYMLYNFRM